MTRISSPKAKANFTHSPVNRYLHTKSHIVSWKSVTKDSKTIQSPVSPSDTDSNVPHSSFGTPIQSLPSDATQEIVPVITRPHRRYSLQDFIMETTNYYVEIENEYSLYVQLIFDYLDWWDFSMLDLATAHPQLVEVRGVLKETWEYYRIVEIKNVYNNYRSPQFAYHIERLPFFEEQHLLDSRYGLPVCSYLAGLFNRMRELIPGFPDRTLPISELVEMLRSLIEDYHHPSPYISRSLWSKICSDLELIYFGVLRDREFRTAPQSMVPWKFSYPVLTSEYLRICMIGSNIML